MLGNKNETKLKILTINLGSTSTKLAYFEDEKEVARYDVAISADTIAQCTDVMEQLPIRIEMVNKFIKESNISICDLDIIVTRGGTINGVQSGAYKVDNHVIAIHRYAARSNMPSTLAAIIGFELAKPYNIPVIFYDAPSADDADDIMHYTGIPEVKRFVTSHCLNGRFVAQKHAKKMGKAYDKCRFIVCHLGGGITISFHKEGRIIDSVLDDAGPMSPQRAGRLPTTGLIDLCYSGEYKKEEMKLKVRGKSGLAAYLGTQDLRQIEKMIEDGDKKAEELLWYMGYQIAKGIGEMSVADKGRLDGIIITGGMAHSRRLVKIIEDYVSFIAPVSVYPGEEEMQALAMGGLRVLRGEETPKKYRWLPDGFSTLEEFLEEKIGKR